MDATCHELSLLSAQRWNLDTMLEQRVSQQLSNSIIQEILRYVYAGS